MCHKAGFDALKKLALSCGEKKFLNEEETVFWLPNLEILERVSCRLINVLCLICLLLCVLPSLIFLSSKDKMIISFSLRKIISPQGRVCNLTKTYK